MCGRVSKYYLQHFLNADFESGNNAFRETKNETKNIIFRRKSNLQVLHRCIDE